MCRMYTMAYSKVVDIITSLFGVSYEVSRVFLPILPRNHLLECDTSSRVSVVKRESIVISVTSQPP